jgi:dCTP diphosphatase
MSKPTLQELVKEIRAFNRERDWEQYHTPKNLAMALLIEAAELAEHFQWLTAEQSQRLDARTRARVREELADVFLYLLNLADKLEIDLPPAARDKIRLNRRKYPAKKVKGRAVKYTDLD